MGNSLSLRGNGIGPAWEGQISTTITSTSTRLRLDQAALLRATLVYYTCTMIDALVYILDDQEPADIYSSLDSELCTKGPASPSLCSSIRPCLNAQVPWHVPTPSPASQPAVSVDLCLSAFSVHVRPVHPIPWLPFLREQQPGRGTESSHNHLNNRSISTSLPTPLTTYAHPTTTPSHPTPPTPPTPRSQTSTSPPPSQTPYADSSTPAAPPR